MATLNIPNSFTNGTPANANEVNANFTAVKSFVEASLVQADGSVKAGTGAITDGAVTAAKLGTDSVTTVKILDSNVTTAKIADSNVTTVKIADSNVTTAKVADAAITPAKLAPPTDTTARTTATVSLALGDENKTILLSSASAQTVNLPNDATVAFAVGTQISFVQMGAGQVTFAAPSGTLNSDTSKTKILVRYGAATAIKTSSNTWTLIGNLTA